VSSGDAADHATLPNSAHSHRSAVTSATLPDQVQVHDTGILIPSARHSSLEDGKVSVLPSFLGEDRSDSLSGLSDASEVLSEESLPRPGSPHGRVASEPEIVAPPIDPINRRNAKNQVATRQQVDSYAQSLTSSIFRNSFTDAALRRVVPGRQPDGTHAAPHVLHPRVGMPGRTSSSSPDKLAPHVLQPRVGLPGRTSSSSPDRVIQGPGNRTISPMRGNPSASAVFGRAVAPTVDPVAKQRHTAPRTTAGGQIAPKPRAGHAIPLD